VVRYNYSLTKRKPQRANRVVQGKDVPANLNSNMLNSIPYPSVAPGATILIYAIVRSLIVISSMTTEQSKKTEYKTSLALILHVIWLLSN